MTPLRPLFWFACAAIGILSLLPAEQLPGDFLDAWDKLQHLLAFAALALLGCLAWPHRTGWVVGGLLAFGLAIEFAQQLSGWRFGEAADWVADALGIVLGWAIASGWRRWRRPAGAAVDGAAGRQA